MSYQITLPPVSIEFERWEYRSIRHLLPRIGVYEIIDELERVIYVGKSTNIPNRLTDHIRSAEFAHEIERIRVRQVTELPALDIYETHAINIHTPKYNRDKVYRPSPEKLAQLKYEYMAACDDVEMYRDQVADLLGEEPCTLRDIDLQIAREALLEAKIVRNSIRQKTARIL